MTQWRLVVMVTHINRITMNLEAEITTLHFINEEQVTRKRAYNTSHIITYAYKDTNTHMCICIGKNTHFKIFHYSDNGLLTNEKGSNHSFSYSQYLQTWHFSVLLPFCQCRLTEKEDGEYISMAISSWIQMRLQKRIGLRDNTLACPTERFATAQIFRIAVEWHYSPLYLVARCPSLMRSLRQHSSAMSISACHSGLQTSPHPRFNGLTYFCVVWTHLYAMAVSPQPQRKKVFIFISINNTSRTDLSL